MFQTDKKKELERYVGIFVDKKDDKFIGKFSDGETEKFDDQEIQELWENKLINIIEDTGTTEGHVIYRTDAEAEKFNIQRQLPYKINGKIVMRFEEKKKGVIYAHGRIVTINKDNYILEFEPKSKQNKKKEKVTIETKDFNEKTSNECIQRRKKGEWEIILGLKQEKKNKLEKGSSPSNSGQSKNSKKGTGSQQPSKSVKKEIREIAKNLKNMKKASKKKTKEEKEKLKAGKKESKKKNKTITDKKKEDKTSKKKRTKIRKEEKEEKEKEEKKDKVAKKTRKKRKGSNKHK